MSLEKRAFLLYNASDQKISFMFNGIINPCRTCETMKFGDVIDPCTDEQRCGSYLIPGEYRFFSIPENEKEFYLTIWSFSSQDRRTYTGKLPTENTGMTCTFIGLSSRIHCE